MLRALRAQRRHVALWEGVWEVGRGRSQREGVWRMRAAVMGPPVRPGQSQLPC